MVINPFKSYFSLYTPKLVARRLSYKYNKVINKTKNQFINSKLLNSLINNQNKDTLKLNKQYMNTLRLYNDRRNLSTIVKKLNKDVVKKKDLISEDTVLSYIDRGTRKNVAYRNRFNSEIAKKNGLMDYVKLLIDKNESYKNIQSYVKNQGMNISFSTIYRIKKNYLIAKT
jgi:hypothetical protein